MTRSRLCQHLAAGLEQIGSPVPADAPERLAALATLVSDWGRRINLSGHRTEEQIADRLILEAAALAAVLPPFESLADLGSGAGFPGLPIAILYPAVDVVLVEARRRRHHFQRAAVRDLAIQNALPLRGRLENVTPIACTVAVAQAVAPADEAFRAIQPWARDGGYLVVPASENAVAPVLPLELSGCRELPYDVPNGPRRKLWIVST